MSELVHALSDVTSEPRETAPASGRDSTARVVVWTLATALGVLVLWALIEASMVWDRIQTMLLVENAGGDASQTEDAWPSLPLATLVEHLTDVGLVFNPDSITFRDHSVDGELFWRLARLGSIKHLELINAIADPSDVHCLVACQRIESLVLCGDRITDESLTELHRLPNLRHLTLDHTRITDAGLASIARIERLETLWIDGAAVTDQGLPALAQLTGLGFLTLIDTKTTFAGRQRLRETLPAGPIEPPAEATPSP